MKLILFYLTFLLASFKSLAQPYFQQKVDTKIQVRLDDKKNFLHGFESFEYTNNSPDTLHYIYIHLWPNAYTSDRTKFAEQQVRNGSVDFYLSKTANRGYIDSLNFQVDGIPVSPFSSEGLPDIARIDLPNPLPPKASMEVTTPFRVKIPLVYSRMGHTGQAYYISQWFPKPAVFDRKGWHPLPFLDQGEFFSEIGCYDVQITLPKNYIVMATGNCLDASENEFWDSLSKAKYPELERPTRKLKRWRDSVNRFPKSSAEWKTLHFHEDNIHDFAWFADKRFVLRKDTMKVAAGAGIAAHEVTIYSAALPSEASYWTKATQYMKQTIAYLSETVGPYPYKTVKAVEGDLKAGGGMEYPTITVVDRLATLTSVTQVLVHEVGHNWFYGVLASNERDDAWMDEGVNTFYEQKITRNIKFPDGKRERYANSLEDVFYLNAASTHTDQSLGLTSAAFTKFNYPIDVYSKTALMLNWLQGYMGADTFNIAMKDYYNTWKFKHPYPEDVAAIFQRNISRPINWFFEGSLATDKGIDFGLKRARTKDDSTDITIKNYSDFAAPVRINAYKNGMLVDSAWTLPFQKETVLRLPKSVATSWRVGQEIPDYFAFNNRVRRGGLLRNKSFKIKPGIGLGRNGAAAMYVLPALGYNLYDGFMLGALFNNLTIPQSRFRYALAPMYGFRSKEFVGTGSLGYWIYPKKTFSEIVPQLDLKSFHYDSTSRFIAATLRARYIKVAPSISFVFKNPSPLSPVTRTLMLKGYAIWENGFDFTLDTKDSLYKPSMHGYEENNYGLLRYSYVNNRTFNPYSYTLEAQVGNTFSKISAEGKLRIDYNMKGKSLYLRGYAGKFISIVNDESTNSRYWLTSSFTAPNDYLYDGTWIGRSARSGFAARQVSIQEGGGKISTPYYGFPLGMSDDWLIGFNIKTDLPFGKLPVRLYLDASTYADATRISPSASRWLYSGGLEIHALHDVFLLHIPLVMCQDYQDYYKSIFPGKKFANSISFSIQFQNSNWLRVVNSGLKNYLD
ncbi:MAG: M1 family metallopeptidase [Chitinophagaceae bacterium]